MRKISTFALAFVISCLPILGNVERAHASLNTQAIEQTLFYLVNQERTSQGLPALTSNTLLTQAAQSKAGDMITRGYFAHTSPDGSQFYEWVDDTGYTYSIVGENLAATVDYERGPASLIPSKMVESWMNSPLHRENMLSTRYSETGIGVVSGTFQGKEAVFAVESFGHPVENKAVINPPKAKLIAPAVTKTVPPKFVTVSTPEPEELVAGTSTSFTSAEPIVAPSTFKDQKLTSLTQKLREFFLNLF